MQFGIFYNAFFVLSFLPCLSILYSQIRSLGHKRKGQKQNNFEAYWEENPSIQAKKWCEKLKVIPIFSHASCQKVINNVDPYIVLLGSYPR